MYILDSHIFHSFVLQNIKLIKKIVTYIAKFAESKKLREKERTFITKTHNNTP